MTDKTTILYLERIFGREMVGQDCPLPEKGAAKLIKKGFVEPVEHQFRDRFGSTIFTLYRLTHKGRMVYCDWCADQDDSAQESAHKRLP